MRTLRQKGPPPLQAFLVHSLCVSHLVSLVHANLSLSALLTPCLMCLCCSPFLHTMYYKWGGFGQFCRAKSRPRRVLASKSAARAQGQRGPWSGSRSESCEHAQALAARRVSDEVETAARRRHPRLSPASVHGPRFTASWRQLTRHACKQ